MVLYTRSACMTGSNTHSEQAALAKTGSVTCDSRRPVCGAVNNTLHGVKAMVDCLCSNAAGGALTSLW